MLFLKREVENGNQKKLYQHSPLRSPPVAVIILGFPSSSMQSWSPHSPFALLILLLLQHPVQVVFLLKISIVLFLSIDFSFSLPLSPVSKSTKNSCEEKSLILVHGLYIFPRIELEQIIRVYMCKVIFVS